MVSAIVLAAGLSARMGSKNKMLLPFDGKTVIEKVVKNIVASGIEDIIVVTGRDALQVHDLLQYSPVKIIHNDDFTRGMTTSIQKGVYSANGNGYMICLGDMPFITSEEYKKLSDAFEQERLNDQACICIAVYQKQKGNPVVFSTHYKDMILQHANMEGCKEIVQAHKQHLYPVEMPTVNVLTDIDTLADYEDALSYSLL
ncbi:MAG: nucleotidyltransferase family protein [Ginsengibacter sp.]